MRLIDADALWDDVHSDLGNGTIEFHEADMIDDYLTVAPSAEAFAGKWISVRDAMPTYGQTVLAIVSGKPRANIELIGACALAEYYGDEGYWDVDEYPGWVHAKVTHWLPIPELPQVSKTKRCY